MNIAPFLPLRRNIPEISTLLSEYMGSPSKEIEEKIKDFTHQFSTEKAPLVEEYKEKVTKLLGTWNSQNGSYTMYGELRELNFELLENGRVALTSDFTFGAFNRLPPYFPQLIQKCLDIKDIPVPIEKMDFLEEAKNIYPPSHFSAPKLRKVANITSNKVIPGALSTLDLPVVEEAESIESRATEVHIPKLKHSPNLIFNWATRVDLHSLETAGNIELLKAAFIDFASLISADTIDIKGTKKIKLPKLNQVHDQADFGYAEEVDCPELLTARGLSIESMRSNLAFRKAFPKLQKIFRTRGFGQTSALIVKDQARLIEVRELMRQGLQIEGGEEAIQIATNDELE
jgi:hypothetical protein